MIEVGRPGWHRRVIQRSVQDLPFCKVLVHAAIKTTTTKHCGLTKAIACRVDHAWASLLLEPKVPHLREQSQLLSYTGSEDPHTHECQQQLSGCAAWLPGCWAFLVLTERMVLQYLVRVLYVNL